MKLFLGNPLCFGKNTLFVIIYLFIGQAFLPAQSTDTEEETLFDIQEEPLKTSTAAEIETLLDTPTVSYGQAARFVLEASDTLVTDNAEEAFNHAVRQGWLPANAGHNTNARLDVLSLLLMRSFEMKGGILYSLTKSSRYAYRELVYLNVILGRHDPGMPVSGEDLLYYINKILAMQMRDQN